MDSVRGKVGIVLLIATMFVLAAVIWYCILRLLDEPRTMEGTFIQQPSIYCETVML